MSATTLKAGALVEDAPKKITASRGVARKQALKIADQLGTASLAWLLVKRHKIAFLTAGNVVLVLNWVFPAWTELVKSFI